MAIAVPGSQTFAQMYTGALQRGAAQVKQGFAEARFNPQETTALANYLERSRRLGEQLGAGGIDDDERQKLMDRVQGYQDLADKFRGGDFSPTLQKDDPFQSAPEALKGLKAWSTPPK